MKNPFKAGDLVRGQDLRGDVQFGRVVAVNRINAKVQWRDRGGEYDTACGYPLVVNVRPDRIQLCTLEEVQAYFAAQGK